MAGVDEQSNARSFWLGLVSLLGAMGTGLQNYMAFFTFLASITRFGWDLLQGLAISLGGVCSGIVNLCINIDLLNKFIERFYPLTEGGKKKKQARDAYHAEHLKPWTWNWLKYWLGIAVFISTGLLFGLIALSFSSVGVLAAVAIAAGIFVSIIMVIQELETWLEAFDPPKEVGAKKETLTFWGKLTAWFKNKSLGHWIGTLVAIANVLALSLLFTVGIAGFLVTVGAPPLAAVISGLSIAFTIGAFTEFYFYNFFLADFCANIEKKWKDLLNSKYWGLGVFSISANAAVNAALCYAGVLLLNPMLIAAGLTPLPLVVPIIAAIFGGLASLLLGADFWIGNCQKVLAWVMGDGLSEANATLSKNKGSAAPSSLPKAAVERVPLLEGQPPSNGFDSAFSSNIV